MASSRDDDPLYPPTSELVRSAKAGEPGGFAALYSRTAPALYAWSETRLPVGVARSISAEDIVQETYLRAYASFDTYDESRPFRSWLFGIAANITRESMRALARSLAREGGDALNEVPDEARAISREVARDEAMQCFVDCVRTLSETERKVLLHRGLEGVPHARVAELAGISVTNAEKTWQRVRERLANLHLPPELFA